MTLKLFVADDSATIQKVFSLAFSESDTVIESVTGGEGALAAIRAFSPDIVFADVCMPGVNGYEICAAVKDAPELSRIPVVLLVGTFEPFDPSEAARVKSDAFLTKPFDTSELVGVVKKLVGEGRMLQDTGSANPAGDDGPDSFDGLDILKDKADTAKVSVSDETWTSFLGSDRILDVFDKTEMEAAENEEEEIQPAPDIPAADANPSDIKTPALQALSADSLPEDVIDRIAERVVKKMSADVIREIAWEVVPELSEILIKRSIEEGKKT